MVFYAAATSPEPENSIRRHSNRISKDRLTTGSMRRVLKFSAQKTEEDITQLEERMMEMVQLCSQESKTTARDWEVEKGDRHQEKMAKLG